MKRNQFIRHALAGTAALFAANWGTLAQIREYKQQDKPLLTEANLNRFFDKCKAENNFLPFDEAAKDTRGFLEKYFSISPEQKKTIARMNEENWKNIQSVIKDARNDKGLLNFKFVQSRGQGYCSTEIRLMQKSSNTKNLIQRTGIKQNNIQVKTSQAELRKVVIQ